LKLAICAPISGLPEVGFILCARRTSPAHNFARDLAFQGHRHSLDLRRLHGSGAEQRRFIGSALFFTVTGTLEPCVFGLAFREEGSALPKFRPH
jgi:hypothetical protein